MKTFRIQNNDLVFDGQNNLAMVEETDEKAQSIERILTTNRNEWFLNTEHGLEYSEIRGKGKSAEGIKLTIVEAISQDERVEDIEFVNVNIDRQKRTLTVDFRAIVENSALEGGEVINIG